jgi:hypothetical protein
MDLNAPLIDLALIFAMPTAATAIGAAIGSWWWP